MRVTTYGKKTPLKGYHKDALESAPEETTRLLQDSMKIADETEIIGTTTWMHRNFPYNGASQSHCTQDVL
jgi:hypothetical protein